MLIFNQRRSPQKTVDPAGVRNPEDDKIVVAFVVHDGNDVAMSEPRLNDTIPCFVGTVDVVGHSIHL